MTARISLAMLAQRDAATLPRCLASAADLVDEIVVITDPNPSPEWVRTAESFGARVVEFEWCDDFAAARNEALRHATGDWCFYLDADEWLDATQREALCTLLSDLPEEAAGFVFDQISTTALGRIEAIRQIRLFRIAPGVQWRYRVHEQIAPALRALGRLVETNLGVSHDGYSDRRTLARKRARNVRLLAADLKERPDDAYVLFNAGVSALATGRAAEAVRLLDRSRRLSASAPLRAPVDELYAALARAYAATGDTAAAVRSCHEGLAGLPEHPELLFIEGTLLARTGDVSGAEECLRRCVTLRPDHGVAWQVLIDLYLTSGRLDEAEELTDRLAATPAFSLDAVLAEARVRIARGDAPAARRRLEEAVAAAPGALLLHELLVTVLMILDDRAAARAALKGMLGIDPDHRWAARTLAGLAA